MIREHTSLKEAETTAAQPHHHHHLTAQINNMINSTYAIHARNSRFSCLFSQYATPHTHSHSRATLLLFIVIVLFFLIAGAINQSRRVLDFIAV